MLCPSHLGSLQGPGFTFPYVRTKKLTVEINKVIQFGKDLWKLSHPTPLRPRTTSKLGQVVQGCVWLSPWKEMPQHLWASCASAGLLPPWKILPTTTGWNCPCCILPLLASFLLLCISRRLWLCLCYSLPLGNWRQQVDLFLPGLLFLRLSMSRSQPPGTSSSSSLITSTLLARVAPVPQHLSCAAGQNRPLLILQMWVKYNFASISFYPAVI